MYKTSAHVNLFCLRSRLLASIMLVLLVCSFVPSISFAQQPTATLSALSGTVLVNGQEAGEGTVMSAGDVIETQAGASVVLELSDGSQLELDENTKIDLAELSQTGTGARVSKVKMAWGWIRAKLSPGHQEEGSTFDIETPNALVGVKFSQPELEVSFDLQKQETVAKALTVALDVLNLLTGERIVVPVGSTAVITALGIELITGAAGGVLSTKTMAIGAGALAAAGGIAAVAASSGGGGDGGNGSGDGDNLSFTGTFRGSDVFWKKSFVLQQTGTSISGTFTIYEEIDDSCSCEGTVQVDGEHVGNNSAKLYPTPQSVPCTGDCDTDIFYLPDPFELTLTDGGNTLYIGNIWGIELERQ